MAKRKDNKVAPEQLPLDLTRKPTVGEMLIAAMVFSAASRVLSRSVDRAGDPHLQKRKRN